MTTPATDRAWLLIPRAATRFVRRRSAWRAATDGMTFEAAIAHPAWRLVAQANELLLRLGGPFGLFKP